LELGNLLKQARLEAGLSQRQLCGTEITRNMLSQIENGSARPSMPTLQYLAARLGKPVSFFLEEETPSPNQALILTARAHFEAGRYSEVLESLDAFQLPDEAFEPERNLILVLSHLALARKAIAENRLPYARSLLQEGRKYKLPYLASELERQRLLLLAQVSPEDTVSIAAALPADDSELLLRADAALRQGNPGRCASYLDAAEDHTGPRWSLLRGDAAFALEQYAKAAVYYHQAEELALPKLEQCYERLKNYEKAYYYACRQREVQNKT